MNGFNEYSHQAGFLSAEHFSDNELKIMEYVSQKTVLNGYEHTYPTIENNSMNYDTTIDNVLQNYSSAYGEYTTDRIFLLDIQQLVNIYKNEGILGENYHLAKITPEAIRCADYSYYKGLTSDGYWHYWLRTPFALSEGGSNVRCIAQNGEILSGYAWIDSIGIRPAFYIKDNCCFENGNGSKSNPYNTPDMVSSGSVSSVSMMSPSATIKVGDTYQAMAYCMPTNAADKALTWSTNNPLVATVNNNGVVTAKGPGKATITAKSNNGKSASSIVNVMGQSVANMSKYPTNYAYSFINSDTSFGYSDIYSIPIERYVQAGAMDFSDGLIKKPALNPKVLLIYNQKWGGNCFGMSASSILFYKNVLHEEKYDKKVTLPYNFGSNPSNIKKNNISANKYNKLRQMIELFHVTQHLIVCERPKFSISDVISELDNGNPVILTMKAVGGGGHAVVIYGYEKEQDIYTLHIYDCSGFVSALQYKDKNAWMFDYENDYFMWKPDGYCTYSTIKKIYDQIKRDNYSGAVSLLSIRKEPTYTYIFRSAENMTITNSLGQISTITDGEVTGEIEDIRVIPSSYLAEKPTYTIILPADTYTITGSGDEVITTSFADDYMSVSVTTKSSTPITISSDLKEISVDTDTDEEYSIKYTTYDNIFDEMTLSGTAADTVSTTLNDTDITITGINTLTASASISDSTVSSASENLSNCDEITVKCEKTDSGATLQILSTDEELTEKTTLPERLTVIAPTYDLESGTYTEGQVLNFTKDDDTIIYYTTDGSIPSADNGIIYSLPIDINKSMTVKAISTKYGYLDSEIVEFNYTLPEVDMPEPNLESGEYDKVITVELSTGDYDDTIYYTLDGSNPLENGILYTVPINISEDAYLQAYTLRNGCISEICEYDYTVAPSYPFYFSNSLVNQEGDIITPDNISELTQVRVSLSKLHSGEHSGTFLIAFYNADNRLIFAKSKSETISEDMDEVEIDITEDVSSAYLIKVFAWEDLISLQPICEELKENVVIE